MVRLPLTNLMRDNSIVHVIYLKGEPPHVMWKCRLDEITLKEDLGVALVKDPPKYNIT